MKNRVLLLIAVMLTSIGFIGFSSILMSEAKKNELYGNVYFKELYLNNIDIYNDSYLISRNSFYIPSKKLEFTNVINYEIFNSGFNPEKVFLDCISNKGIIEIQNNNQELIVPETKSIKESILINYDSNIDDYLECKINIAN